MTKKKSTSKRATHQRAGVPAEFTDAARGIRLQKALADAGVSSRREAEQMIAEGRITVNKQLITALPAFVDPSDDIIRLDGKPIHKIVDTKANERKVCIMLNKPRHCICTSDDPQGRRTVLDLVQYDNMPRLFPVGRLDAESTGLLLLTNDGDLAQELTHPSYGVPKTYQVSIRGHLEQKDIDTLTRGLVLAHRGPRGSKIKRAHATEVKLLHYGRGSSGDRTNLSITLREGQNREIRRLLAAIGFKVRRLERMSIGPLQLKGIASSEWRMLTEREIRQLHKAAKQAKAQTQAIAEGKIVPQIETVTKAPKQRVARTDNKPTARGARKVTRKKAPVRSDASASRGTTAPSRAAKTTPVKTDSKPAQRVTKKVTRKKVTKRTPNQVSTKPVARRGAQSTGRKKASTRKVSGKAAPRGKRRG
ncbi:MAG TPA: hypothetical protein DCM28_03010 [Phycisphaerales bacterium]|nr:hypothetical protein [Phycisphaerales bacterium]HCD33537.1 hypothetical protein [Phycisphaerales bacterium]|tara:strand:- start:36975 stop:38234 length:1260 start_codon:yes stop_codon:yes gene_type:complete